MNTLMQEATATFLTVTNLETGEEIHDPNSYYNKLADRYYGASKIKYMELATEYLEVEINANKFPEYQLINGYLIKK